VCPSPTRSPTDVIVSTPSVRYARNRKSPTRPKSPAARVGLSQVTAYVIAEIEVTDPEGYEAYKALSGPALAAHGGRFIVRGGAAELMEGEGAPIRVVVLAFESMDAARAWYHSETYQEAARVRQRTARSRFVLVEGMPS